MDFNWILTLLTKLEWTAVGWIALTIFSGTELIKRIVRRFTLRYRDGDVWFVAFALGFGAAFFLWPASSTVPWFIVGIAAGPSSNGFYKYLIVLLRWKFPGLASVLTGNKRQRDDPPPGGIERRNDAS